MNNKLINSLIFLYEYKFSVLGLVTFYFYEQPIKTYSQTPLKNYTQKYFLKYYYYYYYLIYYDIVVGKVLTICLAI